MRVVLLVLAALNAWSGYVLLSVHPYLGAANLVTGVVLVGLVITTWDIDGKGFSEGDKNL